MKLINQEQKEFLLEKEFICIGRASENDIIVYDEMVSKRHAVIRKQGFAYFLEDQKSTNGTFVNGVRIFELTPLKEGDKLMFGNSVFCLEDSSNNPYYAKLITQDNQEHIISKEFTYVGRTIENDIIIDKPSVSGRHLLIKKQGSSYFLEDLKARNGTFVNGVRVFETTPLKDGDIIMLSEQALFFKIETKKVSYDKTLLVNTLLLESLPSEDVQTLQQYRQLFQQQLSPSNVTKSGTVPEQKQEPNAIFEISKQSVQEIINDNFSSRVLPSNLVDIKSLNEAFYEISYQEILPHLDEYRQASQNQQIMSLMEPYHFRRYLDNALKHLAQFMFDIMTEVFSVATENISISKNLKQLKPSRTFQHEIKNRLHSCSSNFQKSLEHFENLFMNFRHKLQNSGERAENQGKGWGVFGGVVGAALFGPVGAFLGGAAAGFFGGNLINQEIEEDANHLNQVFSSMLGEYDNFVEKVNETLSSIIENYLESLDSALSYV